MPKAKLNAQAQEQLLQKLQTPDETVSPNAQISENKALLSDENPLSSAITQPTQKSGLKTPKIKETQNNPAQRVTIDLPIEVYEGMKGILDRNGQTIKGFVVSLIKARLAE